MQPENKAKLFAFKSIMNNPKLSKILEDGFNSPVGSTKRDKAKSIISIIKKVGAADNVTDTLKKQSEKLKILKDPYAELYRRAFDGQGGPNDVYGLDVPASPTFLPRIPTPNLKNEFGNPINSLMQSSQQDQQYNLTPPTMANRDPLIRTAGVQPSPLVTTPVKPAPANSAFLSSISNIAAKTQASSSPFIMGSTMISNMANPIGWSDTPPKGGMTAKAGYAGVPAAGNKFIYNQVTGDRKEVSIVNPSGLVMKGINPLTGTANLNPKDMFSSITKAITQPTGSVSVVEPDKAGEVSVVDTTGKTVSKPAKNDFTPGNIKMFANGTYSYVNKDGTIHIGNQGDNYEDKTTPKPVVAAPAPAPSAPSAPSDETTATTAAPAEANPLAGGDYEHLWPTLPATVRTSLLNALTPGQYALSTMMGGDIERLRALFPGVPDNMLPTGAGLQGQIEDLTDRIAEEYHLNQLADERNRMINDGNTLTVDLVGYMDSRDTFIKNVDGMIDRVERNMYGAGFTDPGSMAANKTYIDYLTVLKGRQTGRYIDLLNNSITRHDAAMANITNEYNTNYERAAAKIKSGTEITTALYNQMYTELTNIASKVINGPAEARAAAAEQAAIDTANTKNLTDLAKVGGMTVMEDNKDFEAYFMDQDPNSKTLKFKPGLDLYDGIQGVLAEGKNISSLNLFLKRALIATYGDDLDGLAKGKAFIQKFKDRGGDEMMTNAGYPATFSEDALATLNGTASSNIAKLINTDPVAGPANIKDALNWLTNLDPKDLGSKEATFISKYKDKIDLNILTAIWKYYSTAVLDPNYAKDKSTRKQIFAFLRPGVISDAEAVNDLAKQIAGSM